MSWEMLIFCVIDRRRLPQCRFQPPRLRKLHLEHVRAGSQRGNLLLLRARPVRRPARQRLRWHLRAERPARRLLTHRYRCYPNRRGSSNGNGECCCCNDGGGQYVDEYVGWWRADYDPHDDCGDDDADEWLERYRRSFELEPDSICSEDLGSFGGSDHWYCGGSPGAYPACAGVVFSLLEEETYTASGADTSAGL